MNLCLIYFTNNIFYKSQGQVVPPVVPVEAIPAFQVVALAQVISVAHPLVMSNQQFQMAYN